MVRTEQLKCLQVADDHSIFLAINLSAGTISDRMVELQSAQKGAFAMIFEWKS